MPQPLLASKRGSAPEGWRACLKSSEFPSGPSVKASVAKGAGCQPLGHRAVEDRPPNQEMSGGHGGKDTWELEPPEARPGVWKESKQRPRPVAWAPCAFVQTPGHGLSPCWNLLAEGAMALIWAWPRIWGNRKQTHQPGRPRGIQLQVRCPSAHQCAALR